MAVRILCVGTGGIGTGGFAVDGTYLGTVETLGRTGRSTPAVVK